jgi:hypothetical protein
MKHNWITLGITAAVLSGLAGAQTITPTLGGNTQAVNTGTTTASVQQTVNLKLPEATALHLATTNLEFDISKIGQQDATWYCAYGIPGSDGVARDVVSQLGENFWNQKQVLPLGTKYAPVKGEFGKISIIAGDKVTAYPPVILNGGKVDLKSKAYFVCYRTFVLQKFSNLGNFKLSVTRDTPTGMRGKQLMYIQDNPCDSWGDPTGLYGLPVGGTRELIPMNLTKGTTGRRSANASGVPDLMAKDAVGQTPLCRPYTSWLDDLVVVAVVVDGDLSGDNIATLTYTLESKATPFALSDSDATTP